MCLCTKVWFYIALFVMILLPIFSIKISLRTWKSLYFHPQIIWLEGVAVSYELRVVFSRTAVIPSEKSLKFHCTIQSCCSSYQVSFYCQYFSESLPNVHGPFPKRQQKREACTKFILVLILLGTIRLFSFIKSQKYIMYKHNSYKPLKYWNDNVLNIIIIVHTWKSPYSQLRSWIAKGVATTWSSHRYVKAPFWQPATSMTHTYKTMEHSQRS